MTAGGAGGRGRRRRARLAAALLAVLTAPALAACAGAPAGAPAAEEPPDLTTVTATAPAVPSTAAPPAPPGPTSAPAPEPTEAPLAPGPTAAPAPGTRPAVLARIAALAVAPRSAPEPYRRARFGTDWTDDDRDCHDARAEVLMRDSRAPVTFRPNGCTVDTGSWVDPWNGTASTLASAFQIDHTVPLANAWVTGAWRWTDTERRRFANDLTDPDTLLALEGSNNIAKSDKTPDAWRPQLRSSWCRYADAWSRIKGTWQLTVTAPERDALVDLAASCPG
jgi:hypothetical protein